MPDQSFDLNGVDKKCGSANATISTTRSKGKDITPVCKKSCSRCGKVPNTNYGDQNCKFPYGVELYTFTAKVIFGKGSAKAFGKSGCCNINISWTQCCRSGTLTAGGNWQNFYVDATMNRCARPCDNSPSFKNPPVAIICKDQCFSFNPGMTDPDVDANGNADSLVYSIAKPKQDKTSLVTYTGKYSYDKPLYFDSFPKKSALWNPPSCAGFHLDSFTGDLQFKPTKVEQTVIAIQVQEYGKDSNGNAVLKGTTRRDMQLIVMSCPSNHAPTLSGIDGTSSNDADFCVNQYTCFTINSDDPDKNDTVSVDWNNALASMGATFTVEKKKQHPKSTFCWKPTQANVRSYPYQFVTTAVDDACPLSGRTQRSFRIRVHPSPDAVITGVDSGCGNWVFTLTPKAGTFNAAAGGTIRWSGDDGVSGRTLVVRHHFRKASATTTDSFSVQATLAQPYTSAVGTKTCPVTITYKFVIPPYVYIELPRDTQVCKADSPTITINSLSSGGTTPYVYKWNTGSTSTSLSAKILHDTSFYLQITDNNGSGCVNADTIHIRALVPPKPSIGPDMRFCGGASVILRDTAIHDSMGYTWVNVKKPFVPISDSLTATVTDSGTYVLKVADPKLTSCFNSDTVNVFFNQPMTVVPQIIKACANTPLIMDAGAGKGDTTAIWEWRDLYNPSVILYRGRKVKVQPKQDMHFFVTSMQTYNGLTCGDSDTIQVNLYPLPVVKTSKVPDQCFNNPPIDLSGYTLTPGGTWSMPAFPNAISGGKFYPDSVTKFGSPQLLYYTLRSSSTGCKDSTKQVVTIDTVPRLQMKPDTFMCIDDKKPFPLDSLVIKPQGGTWVGPGVTGNKFDQTDPQAGGDGIKRFTYTYVNKSASGCASSADVKINVLRLLQPNAGPDKSTCQYFNTPQDIDLGLGNLSNFNPRWFLDPSGTTPTAALELTPAGQYLFHPDQAGPGDHAIVYMVSHSNGHCAKTDTMIIHVNANPNISLGSNLPICVGDGPVKLQASPAGVNFTMVNPNIKNAVANSPYFDPSTVGPGIYDLRANFYDKNGCFAVDTFKVQVDDTPHVRISSRAPKVCVGKTVDLYAEKMSGGVTSLSWITSDPTGKWNPDPNDPLHITYVPGTQSVFYIKLVAGSMNPTTVCAPQMDSILVILNPNPKADFDADRKNGCSPLKVQFTNKSTISGGAIKGSTWDFGDNSFDSVNSGAQNPEHTFISDATKPFTVHLRVTANNGCSADTTIQDYITVYATPKPWFDAIPFYTTISLPEITFNDSTTINDPKVTRGDLIHAWDFGDGTTSDTRAQTFTHTYGDTGFYTVKLWVKNPEFNCVAETIRVNYIDIRPELIVFIPNVFTPNHLYNDRTIVNEKFSPVVANYSAYHMEVFSRWGELMYSTTDIKAGWDGNYLGSPCQEGVYIYKVEAVSLEGKKYKYSGSITLLR